MAGDASSDAVAKTLQCDVFDRLGYLQNMGFSTRPNSIAGLIKSACQDNVPLPDIESQQRRFVLLNPDDLEAVEAQHPILSDVTFMQSPTEMVSHPVITSIEIIEASANFWCPVVARRRMKPEFKVKLSYAAPEPVSFTTGVQVHSVDEAGIVDMEMWASTLDQEDPILELANNSVQEQIQVSQHHIGSKFRSKVGSVVTKNGIQPLPDWEDVYVGETTVVFNKLIFESPSNLKPRWLVFSVRLPCGKAIAYTQFKIPTIVLSRRSDQERRAMLALCGEGNIPMEVFWTRSFQYCVDQFFAKTGLKKRVLLQEDYDALAQRSGFNVYDRVSRGGVAEYNVASLENTVKQYLQGIAHMVFLIKDQFDRTTPQTIAGFYVTRDRAEELLMPQDPGVFLLRFGSEIGSLVLSVVKDEGTGKTVQHIRIRIHDIKTYKLENLVAQCEYAKMLLDVSTMHMYTRKHALASDYEHTAVAAHLGLLTPNLCAAGELAIAGVYGIPANTDVNQRITEREQLAFHAQVSAAKQLASVARAAEYIGQLQTMLNNKIQTLQDYETRLRMSVYQGMQDQLQHINNNDLQRGMNDVHVVPAHTAPANVFPGNENIPPTMMPNLMETMPQFFFTDPNQPPLQVPFVHNAYSMVPVDNPPASSISAAGSGSGEATDAFAENEVNGHNHGSRAPSNTVLPQLAPLLQSQQQAHENGGDVAMSSPRHPQQQLAAMLATPVMNPINVVNTPTLEFAMPHDVGRIGVEYADMIDIDEASDEHVRNFLTM